MAPSTGQPAWSVRLSTLTEQGKMRVNYRRQRMNGVPCSA